MACFNKTAQGTEEVATSLIFVRGSHWKTNPANSLPKHFLGLRQDLEICSQLTLLWDSGCCRFVLTQWRGAKMPPRPPGGRTVTLGELEKK